MIAAQESMTAKLCSFARAYHSMLGKNKIFDDHLAYDIIGDKEYERIFCLLHNKCKVDACPVKYGFESVCVFDEMNRFFSPVALSRIAFAERALGRFVRKHPHSQYVILGAGMDTFAYRNSDETIEVFELDHPDTQAYKLRRLHQLHWEVAPGVHYVPVDFEAEQFDHLLLKAGFVPTEAAFFSLLGVAYYLTLEAFRQTVRQIGTLARQGSQFVFDFPDETTFAENRPDKVRDLTELTERLGEPMLHGFSLTEIRGILQEEGFVIRQHESPADIQRHFFEGRIDNQQAVENIHFLLAEKQ
ncbi:class I SAM-dependent methyltransferase [Anaerovibrio slackiae]|uniref:class I SAM-dependent methyltransferase n=1 Tax=Anaerovibrio slackiae TaxID=2652309 RepID=UPI003F145667